MSIFGSPRQLLEALARFDFSGRDEQAIREQWIYPLLQLLGYGLGTPNQIDIPFKVDLASPVRALGSRRWEIDYRPTVHGQGLWIIEAKRPDADLFSEMHLGQAWGYATHPRVDVPFMVLANGARLGVFDLGEDEWDLPILDIQQSELPARFPELEAILGARQVAGVSRRRQLRHLRRALAAQLDEEALEQTVRDVQAIADELRPELRAKQAAVTSEAWSELFQRWADGDAEAGVWGIALAANGANTVVGGQIFTCARLVRERDPSARASAFDEMLSVARVKDSLRQTWSLRILRLAVALRCVGLEGCDEMARSTALELARDAAERFPADPAAEAAHDFERVLPAFLARLALRHGTEAAREAVERARRTFDIERFLRAAVLDGLTAEAMIGQTVELTFRQIWISFEPWTAGALQQAEKAMRELLPMMPLQSDVRIGQVNNANFQTPAEHDPLLPGTRKVLAQVANPGFPNPDDPITPEQQSFASSLLTQYFGPSR